MRLGQIIAIEKSSKTKAQNTLTEAYHKIQKNALYTGITRTYRPKDDDGDKFPSESTKVQLNITDVMKGCEASLVDLFDVTAAKEYANCSARADVIVGDAVLMKDVPVTYLLFLEKQLVNLHTFISKLPVLDPSEDWEFDKNMNCYASTPTETHKTKKVPRVIEKAKATEQHPAQVEVFNDDVVIGFWKTVKLSGALPGSKVAELLDRVERLQRAVKIARENANNAKAETVKVGEKVLSFIFG